MTKHSSDTCDYSLSRMQWLCMGLRKVIAQDTHCSNVSTSDDARTMIGIVQRQADSQFRDAIIGLLVREVLLTPPAQVLSFPLTSSILSATSSNRPRAGQGAH